MIDGIQIHRLQLSKTTVSGVAFWQLQKDAAGDAMNGDGALFTREDAVEDAWAMVDPVLKTHRRVRPYRRGSWGPKEADAIMAWAAVGTTPDPKSHPEDETAAAVFLAALIAAGHDWPNQCCTVLLRRGMMKATQKLHEIGQSLWLDNITRGLLTSGTLRRYIQEFSVKPINETSRAEVERDYVCGGGSMAVPSLPMPTGRGSTFTSRPRDCS